MKYIKKFESYNATEALLLEYGIYKYVILRDDSIDVDHDVDLSSQDLTELPFMFNRINGNFDISGCMLESLKGCPNYVSGNFDCSINQLTSLDYLPKFIGGNFDCYSNNITYIDLSNKTINGYVDFTLNPITNIKGVNDLNRSKIQETTYHYFISQLLDIYIEQNRSGTTPINTTSLYDDILANVIDFEVIKNIHDIDVISLNSLFDYYNLEFNLSKVKSKLKEFDDEYHNPYKFINDNE